MIRQGLGEEGGCFKCVKITLLVVHILGLLGATIMFFVFISLLMSGTTKEDLTPEQETHLRNMKIFAIIMFGFAIIYEMIAIGGIVKENKTVVMVYLVLGILGFVGNLFYGYETGGVSLIVLCLTAFYAYLIVKKDRQMA